MKETVVGDSRVAICMVKNCLKEIKMPDSGSRTNLLQHLVNLHGFTRKSLPPLSQDQMLWFCNVNRPVFLTEQLNIDRCFLDLIIYDLAPLNVVNQRGINMCFQMFCPNYVSPSRTHLTNLLLMQYESQKKILKKFVLKEAKYLSFAYDLW